MVAHDKKFLTVAQAAEELTEMGLKTGKATMYGMFETPGFPRRRIRGKLYVRRDELHRWIDEVSRQGDD